VRSTVDTALEIWRQSGVDVAMRYGPSKACRRYAIFRSRTQCSDGCGAESIRQLGQFQCGSLVRLQTRRRIGCFQHAGHPYCASHFAYARISIIGTVAQVCKRAISSKRNAVAAFPCGAAVWHIRRQIGPGPCGRGWMADAASSRLQLFPLGLRPMGCGSVLPSLERAVAKPTPRENSCNVNLFS